MCGRVIVDYEELIEAASETPLREWMRQAPVNAVSSWNVKPTQQVPVVCADPRTGAPRFDTAYWSLVPPWSKDLKLKFPTFNARSETAAEKKSFAESVRNRRCVIPVSGFYEWTGPKSDRVPNAIFGVRKVLPLAGLLSWWHEPDAAPDAGWHATATVLTCAAAGVMEPLHDRMPVFLDDSLLGEWLDPAYVGDQQLLDRVAAAAVPLAADLFAYPVAPLRGDGPELILPR